METHEAPTREMEYQPIGYHQSCFGQVWFIAVGGPRPEGGRMCMTCGVYGPSVEVTEKHPLDEMEIEVDKTAGGEVVSES